MPTLFTKDYFTKNRINLLQKLETGIPVVLSANTLVQYSADTAFPFRQDNNFWYITGIDEPDFIYIFDGNKETIVLPKQNSIKDIFDGEVNIDHIKHVSGIDRVVTYKKGQVLLQQLVAKHDHIATLLPATLLQTRYGVAPNPARKMLLRRLRRLKVGLTFKHLGTHFAHLRGVKSKEELAAIQASIDTTIEAFKKAKKRASPGVYEYELEAVFTKCFRDNNAQHAYPPIIAGGINATTLHYDRNDAKLKNNNHVLIDVGAEQVRGAADISRTYSVGKPKKLLKDVHSAVIELQNIAFELLKPGILMRDYEIAMEKETGKQLKKLGLITYASRKQIRKYFPHATSHFLGLDVHDAADYSVPLEPGNVLTVEPGIYIPEKGIGVRIEDNILITSDGIKNLSAGLSRDL